MNDVVYNYFDVDRGWDFTCPGWHEVIVNTKTSGQHVDMVRWLYDNIDKPERHSVWMKSFYESRFKFRYERDYIMFTLRWS